MTSPLNSLRDENYEKFFTDNNIDTTKLLEKYEREEIGQSYLCICCFCLEAYKCPDNHSCCKSGKPCNDIKLDQDRLDKEAKING